MLEVLHKEGDEKPTIDHHGEMSGELQEQFEWLRTDLAAARAECDELKILIEKMNSISMDDWKKCACLQDLVKRELKFARNGTCNCTWCKDACAALVALAAQPKQPCGHPPEFMVTSDDGTQFCEACIEQDSRNRAILAAQPSNTTICQWKHDDDSDAWETACGEMFCLNIGTPSENKMRYCPYCGKLLSEVAELNTPEP